MTLDKKIRKIAVVDSYQRWLDFAEETLEEYDVTTVTKLSELPEDQYDLLIGHYKTITNEPHHYDKLKYASNLAITTIETSHPKGIQQVRISFKQLGEGMNKIDFYDKPFSQEKLLEMVKDYESE
jgi:hypothetical protein